MATRLRVMESAMHGIDPRFRAAAVGMIDRGADSAFIVQCLHHPNTNFLENMLKVNVSGFIKKADYSHNYNAASLKSTREFYAQNQELLKRAQDSTGVPASVITSILWVETKFGKITGTHNVVSVYASLAAAGEAANIDSNKASYRSTVFSQDSLVHLDSMVESRAHRKARWAIDQLMALRDMQTRLPLSIFELKGSWAGAFGWSQFIPSSYLSWAIDGNNDGKVNLFDKEDAAFSVGNYLKVNGWTKERTKQEGAVFHYNNSKDYVNCVLKLAELIEAGQSE